MEKNLTSLENPNDKTLHEDYGKILAPKKRIYVFSEIDVATYIESCKCLPTIF